MLKSGLWVVQAAAPLIQQLQPWAQKIQEAAVKVPGEARCYLPYLSQMLLGQGYRIESLSALVQYFATLRPNCLAVSGWPLACSLKGIAKPCLLLRAHFLQANECQGLP